MRTSLRIGNGCGFWGDNVDAPLEIVRHGKLDYLTLEYLAELTMSILALLKQRDPTAGYAHDFLGVLKKLTPELQKQPHLKITTNAGGMNPRSCGEQARAILNAAGLGHLKIGVVTTIVGIWQYRIVFTGEQNHAGTTRMAIRKDAGLALARFCVAIDEVFPAICGPRTVWTTGRMALDPGAPSIIPGHAEMLFQMRDADAAVIERLEEKLRSMASEATARGPCSVAVERLRTGTPATMDASFQDAIEAASAEFADGKSLRMPSGAGHDAQVLATIMPSGMLFVPSIGGISHHWTENTADEDIVTGAEVFVETCRRLLTR